MALTARAARDRGAGLGNQLEAEEAPIEAAVEDTIARTQVYLRQRLSAAEGQYAGSGAAGSGPPAARGPAGPPSKADRQRQLVADAHANAQAQAQAQAQAHAQARQGGAELRPESVDYGYPSRDGPVDFGANFKVLQLARLEMRLVVLRDSHPGAPTPLPRAGAADGPAVAAGDGARRTRV